MRKKMISENSVLSSILSKSTNKYKTQEEIEKYLASLYGANFNVNVEKYGDIENVELLASEIGTLLDKELKQGQRKRSGLLITHLGYILNFVNADKAHVLMDGKIACSGNPSEIIEDIQKNGFNGCVECAQCSS